MNRLGIYVQVPFCQTKCTYCNFHTGVVSQERFSPYAKSVSAEIRGRSNFYQQAGVTNASNSGLVVDTVYIGGGTPSLLDPHDLGLIIDAIRDSFECGFTEVTLEADPETIDAHKSQGWRTAGINRISFGLQSFSDKELIAAGRMHRRADIYRAEQILRAVGIQNISFDLIAGLAHQTPESWEASLSALTELSPEHVSVYVLEVDEGSRLGAELLNGGKRYGAQAVSKDDQMAEFYERAQVILSNSGYHHYEISNWAKGGYESIHNLKYWRRGPYLGFGAGAHSFSGIERWSNVPDASAYTRAIDENRSPIIDLERLTSSAALEEELFLGMRQLDGINLQLLEKQYGADLASRFDPLAKSGLVTRDGEIVRLSKEKLSVSNEVFVELLR